MPVSIHLGPAAALCQRELEARAEAIVRFVVDVAVTAAMDPLSHPLTLIKDIVLLVDSGVGCADEFLIDFVRALVEDFRHRKRPMNAIVTHAPIYVRAVDSNGRRAGFLDNGDPVLEIPDAKAVESNGIKVILYPGTDTTSVEITGNRNGTFNLIVSVSVLESDVHTVIYKNVFATTNTTGEIDVASGQYTLALDDDGDGATDRNIQPDEEISTRTYWVYLPGVTKSHEYHFDGSEAGGHFAVKKDGPFQDRHASTGSA